MKNKRWPTKKMDFEKIVMVADEDYHAAKVYESAGFVPTEKIYGVCWYDKKRN